MIKSVKQFIKICSEELPISEPIYEFGSYRVEGQDELANFRPLFSGLEYIGSDIRVGPGVDTILDVQNINLPDESVGTVICCEVFEHIKDPQKAIREIYRILKPSGLAIISAPMHYHIHEEPNDFWRFTPFGINYLLNIFQSKYINFKGSSYDPYHVIGVGIKGDFDFSKLANRENEWKQIVDITLWDKLFSIIVLTKKYIWKIFFKKSNK